MMAEKLLQTIGTEEAETELAIVSDDSTSSEYRVAQSDVEASMALAKKLQALLSEIGSEITSAAPVLTTPRQSSSS
jgi:hypothetical protein